MKRVLRSSTGSASTTKDKEKRKVTRASPVQTVLTEDDFECIEDQVEDVVAATYDHLQQLIREMDVKLNFSSHVRGRSSVVLES